MNSVVCCLAFNGGIYYNKYQYIVDTIFYVFATVTHPESKRQAEEKMEMQTRTIPRPGRRELRDTIAALLCGLLVLLLCGCQRAEPSAAPAPEPAAQAVLQTPEPEPEPEPEYSFHQNYMSASDGFFRPDEPLRRVECAQLLYNLTHDARHPAASAQYDDVQPEYWYYEAVSAVGGCFPQAEGETRFFPGEPITAEDFLAALYAALGLTERTAPDALQAAAQTLFSDAPAPEDGQEPEPVCITRAQAAVLVNRALGREPDRTLIANTDHTLLLDVTEDRADHADLVEAVLPHEAYIGDAGEEHYRESALDALRYRPGVHLSGASGYVVDANGRALRGAGFLDEQGRRYYRCDASGRILADASAHYADGHAFFVWETGALRRNCTTGEYRYDENGFYTTGSPDLDDKLDAFIAACTTEDMAQAERLRACYDAVRALRYLGRNPAYGPEVKTIPYDKQLTFADKILTTGKGDCYNFAAVFCLLARRLGYLAVPVVGECGYSWNWYPIAHGWVEIEIDGSTWLFDPQIENYNLRAGISNETHSAWKVTYETAPAHYLKH